MKYYKQNNEVYAYESDGSQDHLIGDKIAMTAEEIELHINPPKSSEQLKAEIANTVQLILNEKAREYRYDNILSARSYAGYVNQYQAEATKLAQWASDCWAKVGELEALNESLTVEQVLAEMPVYV